MGALDLRVTVTEHGDAPPEVVWERYADLTTWPTWSPQVTAVEAPSMRLAAGLEGTVVGLLGVRVPFVVIEVGIRSWAWEVRPLGLRVVLDHRVLPRPGGTATELELRGPAPVVLAYLPFAKVALRKLVTW